MEKLLLAWTNLKSIGFFPEITLAGMAAYFLMRFFLNKEKLQAIKAIVVINLLGQLYYDMPGSDVLNSKVDMTMLAIIQSIFRDIVGTIFFTFWQVCAAIAIYSLGEALGLIEYLKKFVNKKASDSGITIDKKD